MVRLVDMCTYAYDPRRIARAYTARVKVVYSFTFMVFGDTS